MLPTSYPRYSYCPPVQTVLCPMECEQMQNGADAQFARPPSLLGDKISNVVPGRGYRVSRWVVHFTERERRPS